VKSVLLDQLRAFVAFLAMRRDDESSTAL